MLVRTWVALTAGDFHAVVVMTRNPALGMQPLKNQTVRQPQMRTNWKRRAVPRAAIEAAVAVTMAAILREALPAVTDSQLLLLTSSLCRFPDQTESTREGGGEAAGVPFQGKQD